MDRTKLSLFSGWTAVGAGLMWLFWTAMPWSSVLAFALGFSLLSLIGLHAGQQRHMGRAGWAGLLVALCGLGLALVSLGMIAGIADRRQAGMLEILTLVGVGSSGAGLALCGAVAQDSDRLAQWRGMFLQLGILTIASTTWFWFFILNQPYPSAPVGAVWIGLGVLVGIGWIRIGLPLVSYAQESEIEQASERS